MLDLRRFICQCYLTFFFVAEAALNKLECVSLTSSGTILMILTRARAYPIVRLTP
jgi:hypothetical protein